MKDEDIRWQQRFSNFNKAMDKLSMAIEFIEASDEVNEEVDSDSLLSEILREGLIQRFEYTFELAWNVMKDYAIFQGKPDVAGARDAIREALQLGIISNGQMWMEMIGSRNRTSHTYNKETADDIFHKIVQTYHVLFFDFQKKMNEKSSGE